MVSRTIFEHCRLRVVQTNDVLDKEMKARASSALVNLRIRHSKSPLTALLRKRIFNLALFAIAVKEVCSFISSLLAMDIIGVLRFQKVQVETFPMTQSIALRLLRNGCIVYSANVTDRVEFPDLVEMDGFELSIRDDISAQVVLKGSRTADNTTAGFFTVGGFDVRWTKNSLRFLSPSISLFGGTVVFDYRPPLAWFAENIVRSCLVTWGCVCSAFSGLIGFPVLGRVLFLIFFVCLLLTDITIGFLYFYASLEREAFGFVISAVALCIIVWTLYRHEIMFSEACIAFGVLTISSRLIRDCALFQDCAYLIEDVPMFEVTLLASGILCAFIRQRFVQVAVMAVESDRVAFEDAWAHIEDKDVIRDVTEAIDQLPKVDGTNIRQYNRQRRSPNVGTPHEGSGNCPPDDDDPALDPIDTVPANADHANPIRSLDQLYTQALGVASVLHAQCTSWAIQSRASFQRADGQCSDHDTVPHSLEGWIQRGIIKRPNRAMEKAHLCYGGDVSRLLDVCRGRILFRTIADLRNCLQAILQDSELVRVVRVKNLLKAQDHWHLRSNLAGFKAVILSVRFDCPLTRTLGVENHVCELQLVPSSFFRLMTEAQHSRYLLFRSLQSTVLQWRGLSCYALNSRRLDEKSAQAAAAMECGFGRHCDRAYNVPLPGGHNRNRGELAEVREFQGQTDSGVNGLTDYANQCNSWSINIDDDKDLASATTSTESSNVGCLIQDHTEALVQRDNASEKDQILVRVFFRRALMAGDELDRRVDGVHDAIRQSDSSSAWFTSKPIANLVSKRTNQVLLIILASYYVYCACLAALAVHEQGHFPSSNVRFQLLAPNISDSNRSSSLMFGLLSDACKIEETSTKILHDGISLLHDMEWSHKPVNGYYFQIHKSFMYMPLRWIVQIRETNHTEWFTAGASTWRRKDDGSVLFYPQLPYVPATGNRLYSVTELHNDIIEIGVDTRPHIQWFATYIAMYSSNAIWLVIGFIFAVIRKEGSVNYFTILLFAIGGTIELLSAIGYRAVNEEREYWCMLLLVPGDLVFALGVYLFESQLVKIFFLYSALGFFAIAVQEYIYEFDGFASVLRILQSAYAVPTVMACVIVLFRWRAIYNAHCLICRDKECYEGIWTACVSEPVILASLHTLKEEVDHLQSSMSTLMPRQRVTVSRSDSMCGSKLNYGTLALGQWSWSTVSKTTTRIAQIQTSFPEVQSSYLIVSRPCLNNLDQLYVQATCLHPILIRKVSDWASKCNGLALITKKEGGQEWMSFAEMDAEEVNHIKWCKIKAVQRAVEKAVRSYGQDVSRLVDICRQSICFKNIQDLTQCFKNIAADEEAHLVRIKNRLDPMYDGRQSAGYRDLALNLCLSTESTISLGLEEHVCELQLILQSFADVKSDEGHRRYVIFRDLKGE